MEHIALLTAEGIYHQMDSIFAKPINISLTMANDNLLKNFLIDEEQMADEGIFIQTLQHYLLAYKDKYHYDSVFLVSTGTNRYYNFNGINRILTPDNPENVWYYSFLKNPADYALNIDNDEAAHNEIVIFINCKITDQAGKTIGVVGAGFRVDYLQEIFKQYETKFGVKSYLVNGDGMIEVSSDQTGYQQTDLFSFCDFSCLRERIISEKEKYQYFWYGKEERKGYLVVQYVQNLEWYLIVDNDASVLTEQTRQQLFTGVMVIFGVVVPVLLVITYIIRKYNVRIVNLAVEQEKRRSSVFQAETGKLYENIYEIDITHNRAASEATEVYFESLGVPRSTTYNEALRIIARKHIKTEYRRSYLDTFSPDNILRAYQAGRECLRYDFMISNNAGRSYYWMRITARIFYWDDDDSVRMFVYRQNVDKEKEHEQHLVEKMESDSLTGLYNKVATQEHIQRGLLQHPDKLFAFFILDIDNFKNVNDTCGHAAGDMVIAGFAEMLKNEFRNTDIVGRIGGDEFVVFAPAPSREWGEKKARDLVVDLRHDFTDGVTTCSISTSIGVAMVPEAGTEFETLYKNADSALYHTKQRGKNGFTIYRP